MRNCFVLGCDQVCKGVSKRMMFKAPKDKDLFDAWMAVLPHYRQFKAHDKVCERHFREEEISTTYDNIVEGVIYKIERGRPRLRASAVPTLNLNPNGAPKYRRSFATRKISKMEPTDIKKLKNLMNAESESKENEQQQQVLNEVRQLEEDELEEVHDVHEIQIEEQTNTTVAEEFTESEENGEEERLETIEISEIHGNQELFDSLYDDIYEVVLPNTLWGVHRCPERSAVFFSFIDPSVFRTTKMITINNQGQAKIVLGNRLLTEQSLICDINSIEGLSEAISQIDDMKLCLRVYDNELCEVTVKEDSEMCSLCSQTQMQ